MLDTQSQLELAFNPRERFAMCSTFKWLLAAAILQRVEAGALSLKTGNGANGAANDLLIAWPPGRSAVIAAVYLSESTQPVSALDQAHAEIGGLFAAAVARQ